MSNVTNKYNRYLMYLCHLRYIKKTITTIKVIEVRYCYFHYFENINFTYLQNYFAQKKAKRSTTKNAMDWFTYLCVFVGK